MKILIWITLGLWLMSLTACSSPTVKQVQTRRVAVPVMVKAIKPEDIPTLPLPLRNRPANPAAAADLLLAKFCEVIAYVYQADPLLRVSAGLEPRPFPRYPQCEDVPNGK